MVSGIMKIEKRNSRTSSSIYYIYSIRNILFFDEVFYELDL